MTQWILTEHLMVKHLQEHPVWEYVNNDDEAPDTAVRPVSGLPVEDLRGRLIGTMVKLQNRSYRWAVLSNVSLRSVRLTKHSLCIWVEKDGRWFELARYHDVDFERRSPSKLAQFLGLSVSEVFPLEYDISQLAVGEPGVVRGTITETPEERLTEDEIIELALQS